MALNYGLYIPTVMSVTWAHDGLKEDLKGQLTVNSTLAVVLVFQCLRSD